MNILIGSRALQYWNHNLQLKNNTDIDIISDAPIEGAEFHDRNHLNNNKFDQYAVDVGLTYNDQPLYVMNPLGLRIIKRSHLHRSNLHFDRHITFYHKYIIPLAPHLSEYDMSLLEERTMLTKQAYPQGHPSLRKTVADFFDDAVTKVHNHDMLHEMIAYYDAPLYTRLQRDPSMAWCERDLWETLSYDDKCKCVAEESYVIAIERYMVPRDWYYAPKLAYIKSLERVCTTLCSGYFRDFAIDNYPQIVNLFDQQKILDVKCLLS